MLSLCENHKIKLGNLEKYYITLMYMFSHVLNFKHKKNFFTRMRFRASRISLFCTNYYSHRLKFILKFAQFCIAAKIENKIRVSIFNTHEVVLQNKLAQFVIFLQAAKFYSRKINFQKLIDFRTIVLARTFGTNFRAFWNFSENARKLVRAVICIIKIT